MSLLGNKWIVINTDEDKSTYEKILENRDFSEMKELKDFHDPFLFEDMERAVERIEKAVENKERIIVFGDYDVDGITGTTILFKILNDLNATVSCRIPHRVNDGYGLSTKYIEEFKEKDIKLIITVDCGISCIEQVKLAHSYGINTIITDHHTVPKHPPAEAVAILHPKINNSAYPFKELTGAGVALKLAHALIIKNMPKEKQNEHFRSFLDLASLGTVADLGPLLDENRLIVKEGLKVLEKTKWKGLKKIMKLSGIKDMKNLNTDSIGFQIAPRINAAGRIDTAYVALNLLIKDDEEKINLLGRELEDLNNARKIITEKTMNEVEAYIFNQKSSHSILIAENKDWHVGVVGLAAGKLVEKYDKPAIIMQDLGDTLVGSARSPVFFNIIDAITEYKDLLMNFGGHACAAGFTLSKKHLVEFKEKLNEYTKEKLKGLDLRKTLKIDCHPLNEEINLGFHRKMQILAPFGIHNQKPVFILKNVEPYFVSRVGNEKNHLKFSINVNNQNINVIAFRMGEFADQIMKHKKIDLVFHLDRNFWNNKETVQLKVLDISLKK